MDELIYLLINLIAGLFGGGDSGNRRMSNPLPPPRPYAPPPMPPGITPPPIPPPQFVQSQFVRPGAAPPYRQQAAPQRRVSVPQRRIPPQASRMAANRRLVSPAQLQAVRKRMASLQARNLGQMLGRPVAPVMPPAAEPAPVETVVPRAPVAPVKKPAVAVTAPVLRRWLRPEVMRTQFILTEILQPPVALREPRY